MSIKLERHIMIPKLILAAAGIAAAMALAPTASADVTLTNIDVAGIEIPIPSWASGAPVSYKTGYNISPRYEFTTDPVTGKRHAKYDNGCNGSC